MLQAWAQDFTLLKKFMKTIILLLALFTSAHHLFAQKNERFCIVEVIAEGDAIYVSADSGQASFSSAKYVMDANGFKRYFTSNAGALNYFGSLGWKIVPVNPHVNNAEIKKRNFFLFKKEE